VQVPRAISNRPYRLEEVLGQGQLAIVYRAVDTKRMVDRAIKMEKK
jgi:serine/threonine protein kinase